MSTPEMTDFGISGGLAGPWDRMALQIGLHNSDDVRPRWFNAERALLLSPPQSFVGFPDTAVAFDPLLNPVAPQVTPGYYLLAQTEAQMLAERTEARICFGNGLCWLTAVYDAENGRLELGWQVGETLQLPEIPTHQQSAAAGRVRWAALAGVCPTAGCRRQLYHRG